MQYLTPRTRSLPSKYTTIECSITGSFPPLQKVKPVLVSSTRLAGIFCVRWECEGNSCANKGLAVWVDTHSSHIFFREFPTRAYPRKYALADLTGLDPGQDGCGMAQTFQRFGTFVPRVPKFSQSLHVQGALKAHVRIPGVNPTRTKSKKKLAWKGYFLNACSERARECQLEYRLRFDRVCVYASTDNLSKTSDTWDCLALNYTNKPKPF